MNKTPHTITDELLDQLLANYQKPEDLIGTDGILKQLTKKLVERALDADWRWVSTWPARRKSSACGSPRTRAPSSGCRW